jgi:ATP-dependent DNA ligase
MQGQKIRARFIEPMLLERAEKFPQCSTWEYELKLDGFRAVAFKTVGRVHLRSKFLNDSVTHPYWSILAERPSHIQKYIFKHLFTTVRAMPLRDYSKVVARLPNS